MHVKVINYRRCVEAELAFDKIALVVGRNSEGKSSLIQAVALALAHQALPYGLTKGGAGQVVNDAAKQGFVEVSTEAGGTVKIGWPSAEVETSGKAPSASRFATGLASLAHLEDKERADVLVKLIRAMPTKDDLKAALAEIGMKAASADLIWDQIEANGWQVAVKDAEDKRAARKSDYEQITGTRWGSDKGAAYTPAGWTEDLDGAVEGDLDQAVTLAKAKVDDALLAQGADEGEKARLKGIAEMLPTLEADLEAAETDLQTKAATLETARKERGALPATGAAAARAPETHACPACGVVLEVRTIGGGLAPSHQLVQAAATGKKAAEPSAEVKGKIAGADGALSKATAEHGAAQRKVHEVGASAKAAADAKATLDGMKNAPQASAQATAEARGALATAEGRAKMWRQRRDALTKHRAILNWDAVAKILAPQGLRQKKLAQSLDMFNSRLAALCEAAAWPVVSITAEEKTLTIRSAGRDYRLVGDNEQFRCRAVLACAMAVLDGSEVVILDGCDILDMPSRSGLLKLMEATGKPSILAMTVTLPKNAVPDLAKSGRGATFVIEDGRLRAFDAKKDVAA